MLKRLYHSKNSSLEHTGLTAQLEALRKELYDRLGEHDIQLTAIYDVIEDLLDSKAQIKNGEDRERIGFKK